MSEIATSLVETNVYCAKRGHADEPVWHWLRDQGKQAKVRRRNFAMTSLAAFVSSSTSCH